MIPDLEVGALVVQWLVSLLTKLDTAPHASECRARCEKHVVEAHQWLGVCLRLAIRGTQQGGRGDRDAANGPLHERDSYQGGRV